MTERPARLAPLARRARCTEGQLCTMAIGVVVTLLLAWAGLPAAFRDGVRPGVGAATERTTSTTGAPAPTTSLGELVADPSSPYFDPDSLLLTAPPDASGSAEPNPPAGEEASIPCESQAAVDLTGELLRTLNVLGVLPEPSVTLLLSNLAGCDQGDPVVLVMGVLAELGGRLPDPGFDLPVLPIPAQDLPPEVVALAQPLRDAIDPICAAVASLSQIAFYGLAGYPLAIDRISLQALQQVLLVCGQLQA